MAPKTLYLLETQLNRDPGVMATRPGGAISYTAMFNYFFAQFT